MTGLLIGRGQRDVGVVGESRRVDWIGVCGERGEEPGLSGYRGIVWVNLLLRIELADSACERWRGIRSFVDFDYGAGGVDGVNGVVKLVVQSEFSELPTEACVGVGLRDDERREWQRQVLSGWVLELVTTLWAGETYGSVWVINAISGTDVMAGVERVVGCILVATCVSSFGKSKCARERTSSWL